MSRIRCFFLEPTGRVRVKLRRYVFAGEGSPCSSDANPYTYHASDNAIEEELAEYDAQGYIENSTIAIPSHTDNRWPTACQCGYMFQADDEWQKFTEQIYRRVDTGEEMTIREAPAGAMWYAWWLDSMFTPQLEHVLEVKTPGGEWTVDGKASNCTMKDDWKQERHHCWVLSGTLPNITAGKGGLTCSVGAGSIQCGSYHGFLRGGYLED
jgi:hypothetical protein